MISRLVGLVEYHGIFTPSLGCSVQTSEEMCLYVWLSSDHIKSRSWTISLTESVVFCIIRYSLCILQIYS